jgi:hypothetical protein
LSAAVVILPRCLRRALLGALALLCTTHVAAGPTPERAAACVAALKLRADALGARLPKEPRVEPELVAVLEQGFAFIGDAYLHGMRDKARADALLAQAEQAQKSLTPPQMAERQAGCQAEALRLLKDASPFGRLVVSHQARKRVDRIKQKAAAGA